MADPTDFPFGHPFDGYAPADAYEEGAVGAARLSITPGGDVQSSTYGGNSFIIENVGEKRVAAVLIDISEAVLTDAVFDPLGIAGDSVSRGLVFGDAGGTGARQPGPSSLEPFFGAGGSDGYEALLVEFDTATDSGFESREIATFGVDIDPNSILGIPQTPRDVDGDDPRLDSWDIGGVSGGELAGAVVQVLFTDGSRAEGRIFSDASQGGGAALVTQSAPPSSALELSVNGFEPGEAGSYDVTNSVVVAGPSGSVARIAMVQGFAQPFDYVAPGGERISVTDRLAAAQDPFGANNAFRIQTVDLVLDGTPMEIGDRFDFGRDPEGPRESGFPIAFSASTIDDLGTPTGSFAGVVYLRREDVQEDEVAPSVTMETGFVGGRFEPLTVKVTYEDDVALDVETVEAGDLRISGGSGSIDVLSSSIETASDGLSATVTYSVLPRDGWSGDVVEFTVPSGAVEDAFGNANAAAARSVAVGPSSAVIVDSLAEMTQLALQGVSLVNPTSIDVGADGRLYVSQQDGLIVALAIERSVVRDFDGVPVVAWSVTGREDISAIREIPNHDDDGAFAPGVVGRQVTGLVTTTDEDGRVVLYVGSSDPRIGGGGSGIDKGLDTNSGVISRLTRVEDESGRPVWEKVDLVRGLPRSEENHSVNGLALAEDWSGDEVLLAAVGGFTNQGAQSNNFAYTPEYYYSASVVRIDLAKLERIEATEGVKTYAPPGSARPHAYLHDLPTLDDPTRPNRGDGGDLAGDGSDTADVFGGNDGLNQAIFDPSGVVQVAYAGFRNNYDLVVTEDGAVFTVDNGSNFGWGGPPVNADGEALLDGDGDGSVDNGPGKNLFNDLGGQGGDSLQRIDDDIRTKDDVIYYGGHPNLYRAYGADAGFHLFASPNFASERHPDGLPGGTPLDIATDAATGEAYFVAASEPVDLRARIADADSISGFDAEGRPIKDPRQALYDEAPRQTGHTSDKDLFTFFSSTNGLDTIKVDGALKGALVTVSFNGSVYALPVRADGGIELGGVQSRSLTSAPLDLVAQGEEEPYPGVIFVAAYGADQIVILSPEESRGVEPDPYDRDLDGVDDTIDPFAADPDNGTADVDSAGDVLRWSFVNGEPYPNDRESNFDGAGGLYNGGGIGFTGIMTNRSGLPESLYVQDNIIFGGAPGVLQVKTVEAGEPGADSARNGFQFGISPGGDATLLAVTSRMDNFIEEISAEEPSWKSSQGIFVGSGDQNNFISISLVRSADGRSGFETASQFSDAFVGESAPEVRFHEAPDLVDVDATDTVELGLIVNVSSETVTPTWSYSVRGDERSGSGPAIALQGDALRALRGDLLLPTKTGGQAPIGMAVGVASSGGGAAVGDGGFAADWDDIEIRGVGAAADDDVAPTVSIDVAGGVSVEDEVIVKLTYSDDNGFGVGGMDPSGLLVHGPRDYEIASSRVVVDQGLIVEERSIAPRGGWIDGETLLFRLPEGDAADLSGNPTEAVDASFTHARGAGAADRIFEGGPEDDVFRGGAGNDDIVGGDGSDTLFGGAGADYMRDGGADGSPNRFWAGPGVDTVIGGSGDDVLGGGNDADLVRGGRGNDVIYGGGDEDAAGAPASPGDDRLHGEAGDDFIYGGRGRDRIEGGSGDDVLFNGPGSDQVDGGPGSDEIWGGAGNDVLAGGAGDDVFAFVSDNGDDVVADFEDGLDLIRIVSEAATAFGDLFVTQEGDDALIAFEEVTVTLLGVPAAVIGAEDFVFG